MNNNKFNPNYRINPREDYTTYNKAFNTPKGDNSKMIPSWLYMPNQQTRINSPLTNINNIPSVKVSANKASKVRNVASSIKNVYKAEGSELEKISKGSSSNILGTTGAIAVPTVATAALATGNVANWTGSTLGVAGNIVGSVANWIGSNAVAGLQSGNPFFYGGLLVAAPSFLTYNKKYKNSAYNNMFKATFEERYANNEFHGKSNEEIMEELYNHFSEPQGKYFQDLNDNFKNEFNKTPGWGLKMGKDVDKRMDQYRQVKLVEAVKFMQGVPKDAIFLTFEISFGTSYGLIKNSKSYLRPNFIGPRHVLEKIHEIFNINNDVAKFLQILKRLQKISFYNTSMFNQWRSNNYNNNPSLYEVCDYLLQIMNKQRGMDVTGLADAMGFNNTINKLPKPSAGIKGRHGMDHNYSSVMFIGKHVGSTNISNTELHKKWCWLKNSDGFIYDGEFLPADMQIIFDGSAPKAATRKLDIIDGNGKQQEFNIPYYEFEWAGFQTNIFDSKIQKGLRRQSDAAMASLGYTGLLTEKSKKSLKEKKGGKKRKTIKKTRK